MSDRRHHFDSTAGESVIDKSQYNASKGHALRMRCRHAILLHLRPYTLSRPSSRRLRSGKTSIGLAGC